MIPSGRDDVPSSTTLLTSQELVIDAWGEVLGEGFLGVDEKGVVERVVRRFRQFRHCLFSVLVEKNASGSVEECVQLGRVVEWWSGGERWKV